MIQLDFEVDMRNFLIKKLELDKYVDLIMKFQKGQIDKAFKNEFKVYYKIIYKNELWCEKYFYLMQTQERDFEKILRSLYEVDKQISVSFASKLVATVDTNMPIWDKNVMSRLGKDVAWKDAEKKSADERIRIAVRIYEDMQKEYNEYLKSDDGKAFIAQFDATFEEFKDISDVKKLDLMLWAKG